MSFNELLTTFANNLLPIFLVSGAGFVLGKFLTVDSRSLGRVVFYVFSPLLVFDLLLKSALNLRQAFTTVAFTVSVIAIMGLIAFLLGKLFRLEKPYLLAVILTVAFGNPFMKLWADVFPRVPFYSVCCIASVRRTEYALQHSQPIS